MKDYSRRLHITVSGRWYLGLTITIGVVAITTGNNSIYVIESLLLSGLILSGILSEQVIISIDAEIRRDVAIAESAHTNGDQVIVTNSKNRHLFCLEIGEWIDNDFFPIAWISHLQPLQTLIVRSNRVYKTRGIHRWSAIAIATRYPFGFARKIRFKNQAGERMVWPPIHNENKKQTNDFSQKQKHQAGTTLQQNEIRPMMLDDDFRSIVWTLSNKGLEPVVRMRRRKEQAPEITLDTRCPPGPEFEEKVSLAALPFYHFHDNQAGTLTLIDSHGKKTLTGKITILNRLAMIEADQPNKVAS